MVVPSQDPRIGTVLEGRYRVIERLAAGAMGVVYRAERVSLGRTVAVKFLLDPLSMDNRRVTHFEREAKAMSRLFHPNCVPVIDFGVADAPFLVMDFVSGRTLKDAIKDGPMVWPRAVGIVRQLLGGLGHAHSQGVVHRDIKPANIMLTEATGVGEHVRILDFGLAKLREIGTDATDREPTAPTLLAGTPQYMAPEQWSSAPVDGRTDLYSTAVLLFELITGERPFKGTDPVSYMRAHTELSPPKLRDVLPTLAPMPELQAILDKGLQKKPKKRFQTAEEMSDALGALVTSTESIKVPPSIVAAGRKLESAPPTRAGKRGAQRRRKRRWSAWLTGLVLLAGGGVAAWQLTTNPQDGETAGELTAENAEPESEAQAPSAEQATEQATEQEAEQAPQEEQEEAAEEIAEAIAQEDEPEAIDEEQPIAPEQGEEDTPDQVAEEEVPEQTADLAAEQEAEEAEDSLAAPELAPEGEAPDEGEVAEAPDTETEAAQDAPPPDEATDEEPATVAADPPPAPVPAPTPEELRGMQRVRALIAQGKRDAAIKQLQIMRRSQPRNAQLPYMVGKLYYEKGWWSDAFERYREAMELDYRYRKRRDINEQLIGGLGSTSSYKLARRILVRTVGGYAMPHLRRAAKRDHRSKVRARSQSIYNQLKRRR